MKHQEDFHDELLSGYLDGELTAEEQGRVELALVENADLRQTYEELRALRGTLQALPRFSLGNDFTERVVRRLERENAPTPRLVAARRATWWRTYAGWGSIGVAAVVAIAFLIGSRRGQTPDIVQAPTDPHVSLAISPDSGKQEIASVAEKKVLPPATIVEPESKPSQPTAPLVNIGGSQDNPSRIATHVPRNTPAPVAVASIAKPAATTNVVPPTENKPERIALSELLVLEVDAAPAPNHALTLAAALSASKIRLESPLRVGTTVAEGEGVNGADSPKTSKAPGKVEYFVIEGQRANVEALVAQLRTKKQAFPRVENPTALADAIDRLAALDKAAFGEFLPDVNLPAAAASVGSPAKSVGFAVKPENAADSASAPGSVPATASLPQARAYRIDSPAALLSDDKSPAGEHTVRVLLIMQNSGTGAQE